ncbi:hypothetical protein SLA2020_215320 [Shorea laevis]
MNVVGRVGNLITQGVYSVATPFHPFGGAIDVIVVRQQDGTFRSTPWYVRFGKFQGVLKGAEKIVRIEVNDAEADFHMYLDNSGEAYFISEVDYSTGNETDGVRQGGGDKDNNFDADGNHNKSIGDDCRLEHSVSDPGVAQLRDQCESSGAICLERSESDTRFYDFHDDQSSLEGSLSLSEYGSNRYDNDCFGEAQGPESEVVLVSVDGHILTAPVLASEQHAENVQLNTPQFHLGPGKGTDFCEDNEEFSSGENEWAVDYITKLNSSTAKDESSDVYSVNDIPNALRHELHVCEGESEHACQTEDSPSIVNEASDLHDHVNVEDASACNKNDNVSESCLEPLELDMHGEDANVEVKFRTLEDQSMEEKPLQSQPDDDESQDGPISQSISTEAFSLPNTSDSPDNNGSPDLHLVVRPVETKVLDVNNTGSDSVSLHSDLNDPDSKAEHLSLSIEMEGMDVCSEEPSPKNDCSRGQIVETETTSCKEMQTHSNMRFEISLCGNELHAGMGMKAAAEVFDAHRISVEEYQNSAASVIKNKNLVFRFGERYLTWDKAAPIVLGMAAFGLDLPVEPKDAIPVEQDETPNCKEDDPFGTPSSSSRRWRLWPIPFRRVKTLEHSASNSSSEEIFVDTESGLQNSQLESTPASSGRIETPRKQLIRTNVPTSDQIASLNLKDGQNIVTFRFCTRVLGTQKVDAHIHLWKWNDRIVISDVDGTITRSDVLGQFMPLVGRDWSQSGVAALFSAIKENGYQLLFLSARAIVQAYLTRSFLFNLKQDGKTLPNGPVVISPDGLFPSLYREVIRRAPHEFKIACLEDIRKLFPSDYNPFYAGFGNRDTDELSYQKIGIPKGKIFIINPRGEVAICQHRIDERTYTSLHTLVNDMFPPTSLVEQEDYNSWNFWKLPLRDINL